jgi:hypothetical protein
MDNSSSGDPSGRLELGDMITLLARTDDFLIEMGREALRHVRELNLPITEAQLKRLEAARSDSQDSQLNPVEVRKYLASWPEFEGIWANLNRAILRHFKETP